MIDRSDSVGELLRWIESCDKEPPLIFVVRPQDGDGANDVAYHEFLEGPFESIWPGQPFSINDPSSIGETLWRYIPFNCFFAKRHAELIDALKIRGLDAGRVRLADSSYIAKHEKEIKDALDSVSGTRNVNSMCVLSIADKGVYSLPADAYWGCCWRRRLESSCLYTGDYDARSKTNLRELIKRYERFGCIGTLQIPHHGSRHSFSRKLVDQIEPELCFVSCGFQNRYQHPNGSVVRYVMHKGIPFIIVNEFSGTAQYWNWNLVYKGSF